VSAAEEANYTDPALPRQHLLSKKLIISGYFQKTFAKLLIFK
jgi:hypothetical protein